VLAHASSDFFLLSFFFLLTSTIESRWEALKKRNSVQERIKQSGSCFFSTFSVHP
jgi:hypothetical protein